MSSLPKNADVVKNSKKANSAVSTGSAGRVDSTSGARNEKAQLPDAEASGNHRAPLMVFIILMGAAGGFISLRRRLQEAPTGGDLLTDVIKLEHGRFGMMLAPIQGSVFAVLLFLMFAGGALSGTFFPKITTSQGPSREPVASSRELPKGTTFRQFIDTVRPVGGADLALVLIWSFLAGFAERLVPDALDRITRSAEGDAGKEKKKTPP